MLNKTDENALNIIRHYYADFGIIPTYKEIADRCNFNSTGSAFKLAKRLIKAGYLKKIGSKLAPDNLFAE